MSGSGGQGPPPGVTTDPNTEPHQAQVATPHWMLVAVIVLAALVVCLGCWMMWPRYHRRGNDNQAHAGAAFDQNGNPMVAGAGATEQKQDASAAVPAGALAS